MFEGYIRLYLACLELLGCGAGLDEHFTRLTRRILSSALSKDKAQADPKFLCVYPV